MTTGLINLAGYILHRTLKNTISIVIVISSICAGSGALADDQETSELVEWIRKADAIANDQNQQTTWFDVVRSGEAGTLPEYYLRSHKRSFLVFCSDRLSRKRMADHFGFYEGFVDDVERFNNKGDYENTFKIQEGSTFFCDGTGTKLYYLTRDLAGEIVTEYYLFFEERPRSRSPEFFRVGCQGILEAIGKDMHAATDLQPFLELSGFARINEMAIACRKGKRPEAQVLSLSVVPPSQTVRPGEIPKEIALNIDGDRTYDLKLKQSVSEECKNTLIFELEQGKLVFENIPDSSEPIQCVVSLIAYDTNLVSNEARFAVNIGEPYKPYLSWVYPKQTLVKANPQSYSGFNFGADSRYFGKSMQPIQLGAALKDYRPSQLYPVQMHMKHSTCDWIKLREKKLRERAYLRENELFGKAPKSLQADTNICRVVIIVEAFEPGSNTPVEFIPPIEHSLEIDVSGLVGFTVLEVPDWTNLDFKKLCAYIKQRGILDLPSSLTIPSPDGGPDIPVTSAWADCYPRIEIDPLNPPVPFVSRKKVVPDAGDVFSREIETELGRTDEFEPLKRAPTAKLDRIPVFDSWALDR